MSELPEPESKANQDPEQEYKDDNAPILESNDAITPPAAIFGAKRTTEIDNVTGDDFCITTTERISMGNPQTCENPTGNNNTATPSSSMGVSSRNGFGNDALGGGVELYSSKNPQFNGEGVNKGESLFYAQEGYSGQVQQPRPRDMLYDDKNHSLRSEADGSLVLSTSYEGIVSRADGEDGYMNPKESQQPGWEDHAEDEHKDHSSKNDVVSGNENMYGEVVPNREVIDDFRTTEPDHGQIVDAKEGADIIPGVDDLPIFANEQSKELNDEIKRRDEMVSRADNALTDNRERVRIMEEHLKNVRQEVGHTNALIAAKKKEIATEEHLCALAERETGKYAHEARGLVLDAEEAQDKLNVVQNGIFSANEGMDRFKLQMNWNQEELEQWALAAKQKEDDNLALQKYTRTDDVKIKELSLQVERLSQSVVTKRAELQNLEAESSAKQVELDNTADEFRRLHAERQDLVRQWQDAVDGMRRRDDEMNAVGEKYAKARRMRAEKIETLAQNVARLKMQTDNNEEVRGSIEKLERALQRRREEYQDAQKRFEEFRDVLELVKSTLGNGAAALARKRAESANLTAQIEEKRASLETARKKYQVSKHRVATETNNSNKVEATAKSAEEELNQREGGLRAAKKRLAASKEAMFKDSQQLFALRQEEANLIADICGAQTTMKILQAKVHGLDREQSRQQELVYTAEFQMQQMERKVARGIGERTDEEKSALAAKIRELEGEVDILRERKRMLMAQARKLNNELKACLRRKQTAETQQSTLEETINELELECSTAEADVRREAQTKEELMVSNDVMRLEMKRLRGILNGAADEVFSLENRRQQLNMSMKERKAEIQVHWDLQRATLRAAEEERHRVQVELGDRLQTVENSRARFETLVKRFAGGGGDGDGGGSSQAYFVIAAAQRREELQREGDDLDDEIRRRERELRALESTLGHLQVRNVDFRASFQRADPGSRDADALRKLEARVKATHDELFRRKKELQRVETDHEQDVARQEGVRSRAARLGEQNAQLEEVKTQADAQLRLQEEELAKEQARLDRQRARHRTESYSGGGGAATTPKRAYSPRPVVGEPTASSTCDDDGVMTIDLVDHNGETLTEKTLRAGTIRDTASGVLYTLGQVAREFPEIRDALSSALKTRRLRVPPTPPTHGPGRIVGGSGGGYGPEKTRSNNSAGSGSGAGSMVCPPGGVDTRSSMSGGRGSGGSSGFGDRRGSRPGAAVASNGISPMRVFEAPL